MAIPVIRLRREVDPEKTWNSARLFASPQAWEDEYQQLVVRSVRF
jgi:hypothetical protein